MEITKHINIKVWHTVPKKKKEFGLIQRTITLF